MARRVKGCPICGKEVAPPSRVKLDDSLTQYVIACPGASTFRKGAEFEPNHTVRVTGYTKAEAIAEWNRRSSDSRTPTGTDE